MTERFRDVFGSPRKDEFAPPLGLVERTLARVARYRAWEREQSARSRTGPAHPPEVIPFSAPSWRRSNVLVAATLLLFVVGVAIPGVGAIRRHHEVVADQQDMREFHEIAALPSDQQASKPVAPSLPAVSTPAAPHWTWAQSSYIPIVSSVPFELDGHSVDCRVVTPPRNLLFQDGHVLFCPVPSNRPRTVNTPPDLWRESTAIAPTEGKLFSWSDSVP